jgi:hypothetical protein
MELINGFAQDGVITNNRVVIKQGYDVVRHSPEKIYLRSLPR